MQLQIGPHLEEVQLEQYSMGSLPEQHTPAFEEHLLACEGCQARLLEMDIYITAVRTVSPRLRKQPRAMPGWVGELVAMVTGAKIPVMTGFAAALALLVLLRAPVALNPPSAPFAVALEARRGAEGIPDTKAPAGRPLVLKVDLTELPALPGYRLEVVDRSGKGAWQAIVKPEGNRIEQALDARLLRGLYFVRLYAPEGELLREFSLHIE